MEKEQKKQYHMLVGLLVNDDESYQRYRDQMTPILTAYGGGFGYDFKVSEVLITSTDNDINRVFTIYFPQEDAMEDFFSDPSYQAVKETYFTGAVKSTTILAAYWQ